MRKLAEIDRDKLIEVLRERLAAEQASVRLYDVAIGRLARAEPALRRIVPRLEIQRDEERSHVAWLELQLVTLGARRGAGEARVHRVRVEHEGLERVVQAPQAGALDVLHALLQAERGDEDDWQILAAVARSAGDEDAAEELEARRQAEELHVLFLRRALTELTRNDVLGMAVTLPIGP